MQGSHSDWKTWKNGKEFSSQGILNRLEKSGKITQNTGKLREFQTNIICYFLVIFKLTVYYFAKMHQFFNLKNKLLKKYWKNGKNTGKVREFCQSGKVGTLIWFCLIYTDIVQVVKFLFFPIFLSILLFFLFFSNFLLFFLFFRHFTYNKEIFVRDLNILSLFKYVVYRVHFFP